MTSATAGLDLISTPSFERRDGNRGRGREAAGTKAAHKDGIGRRRVRVVDARARGGVPSVFPRRVGGQRAPAVGRQGQHVPLRSDEARGTEAREFVQQLIL